MPSLDTLGSALARLLVLCSAMVASVQSGTSTGLIQDLRAALGNLAGEGRSVLGKVAGEQTVLSVQKAFSNVFKVLSENIAVGLTLLLQYLQRALWAAGFNVSLPSSVSASSVIFVCQWILVALLTFWIISLTLSLLSSALKRALWLLKVCVAVLVFGLILRDHSVGTETMAVRLMVLVLLCVILGVGSRSSSSGVSDKTSGLEAQIRILERRVTDMERRRRMDM